MSRAFLVSVSLLIAAVAGCNLREESSPVQREQFVEFTSHLGNSFIAPSDWTVTDEGDTFSLKSPDGHAAITAIVYTSEGSGTLDEFRHNMTVGLLPKEASGWKDSEWTAIKTGDVEASKRLLLPIPDADNEWRLYVVDRGKYYHAIILSTSTTAMSLNGDFYESIVCTFEGISE